MRIFVYMAVYTQITGLHCRPGRRLIETATDQVTDQYVSRSVVLLCLQMREHAHTYENQSISRLHM